MSKKKKNRALKSKRGTSLMVQWLRLEASNAGAAGSVPWSVN